MKQPGLSGKDMHFEKEGGRYAPVGDRLLVKFAEHEDAREVCGLYTRELYRNYETGTSMGEILDEIVGDISRIQGIRNL